MVPGEHGARMSEIEMDEVALGFELVHERSVAGQPVARRDVMIEDDDLAGDVCKLPEFILRRGDVDEGDERAFALPEAVACGDRIALAIREPESARADLKLMLAGLAGGKPAFGLYFNCATRGASLFGDPGVEAACLANAFADVPIAGLISPYQIAPMALRSDPLVLTYAGALALVDE